jgi:hypothetical protein
MGILMSPDCVLLRVVEDEAVPAMHRVKALELVKHPPLRLLRRLLVEPRIPRKKPVPPRLRAVAALAYAREMALKKIRKALKDHGRGQVRYMGDNALGI